MYTNSSEECPLTNINTEINTPSHTHTHTHTQHDFLRTTSQKHHEILVLLIQRTQEAVRRQDNQSFARNRKMLMNNLDEDEDSQKDETEIESEPPR